VAGTLTLEFYAEDAEWNPLAWSYTVNNLTSYVYGDMQDSTNPDVVNPAVITVAAGDELQIVVNTLDPENMQKFMRTLKCSRESLDQVIEEEFGVHLDKKNFGKWLQENEIKYDYFCWTS
jgi:hypothetical protein